MGEARLSQDALMIRPAPKQDGWSRGKLVKAGKAPDENAEQRADDAEHADDNEKRNLPAGAVRHPPATHRATCRAVLASDSEGRATANSAWLQNEHALGAARSATS